MLLAAGHGAEKKVAWFLALSHSWKAPKWSYSKHGCEWLGGGAWGTVTSPHPWCTASQLWLWSNNMDTWFKLYSGQRVRTSVRELHKNILWKTRRTSNLSYLSSIFPYRQKTATKVESLTHLNRRMINYFQSALNFVASCCLSVSWKQDCIINKIPVQKQTCCPASYDECACQSQAQRPACR